MTPAEHRLRNRINRQIAMLEPNLVRLVLQAFDALRVLLDEVALERLLRESGLGLSAGGTLTDAMLTEAFAKLRVGVQETLRTGAGLAARHIAGVEPGAIFDVLNPNVLVAARLLDTRVMQTLTQATRETFRQELVAGLTDGVGPRTLARRVRSTIGMAPNQAQAVRNFRRMLTEGDLTVLSRKLRDRRFDATLRRALGADGTGLSGAQIERMTAAYQRRMIAFNAEVNARTATIDALRAGQRLSWEQAADMGIVDRSRLMKRRVAVGDSRVRPGHAAISGQVRHIDEPYSNGEMIAGDRSFNCRCLDAHFQAREAAA